MAKANPKGFRLGINQIWKSVYYCKNKKESVKYTWDDFQIRSIIKKRLPVDIISDICIERSVNGITAVIQTSRPGIVIGSAGKNIDAMTSILHKKLKKKIQINVHEISKPFSDASLVAGSIASKLEKMVHHKKLMKRTLEDVMQEAVLGAKITLKGRLRGEKARREIVEAGSMPFSEIRAKIDHACKVAYTNSGTVSVRVSIYKKKIYQKVNLFSSVIARRTKKGSDFSSRRRQKR